MGSKLYEPKKKVLSTFVYLKQEDAWGLNFGPQESSLKYPFNGNPRNNLSDTAPPDNSYVLHIYI